MINPISLRRAWLFIEMITFILKLVVLAVLLCLRVRPIGGGKEIYKLSCCKGKKKEKELKPVSDVQEDADVDLSDEE